MAHTMDLDDFEDDDFDELVSSDNEYDEGKQDNKPSSASLIIKGALEEPRYKTVSVRQLYDMLKEPDQINLNPDYQRDVVWTEPRQHMLIQSIFQHFFMPPVIFGTDRDEDGFETLVCIDGKQRCTSIRRFMDGEIPFITPGAKEKYWYKLPPGKTGKLLPKALKSHFDSRQIQMVQYSQLSSLQQRDIFQRVQMGMPLSAAEKLQALPGEWGRWIIAMEKKYLQTVADHLKRFDISRGRSFQLLASLVLMAYESNHPVPSSATIRRILTRSDHPERSFRDKVEMAMRIMVSLACDHYDRAFGTVTQRLAPVEFCGIAFLIFKRMNSLSVTRLADEATNMRKFLRKRHVDIRSNNKLFKDIYEYVSKVPAGKIAGEPAAREVFNGTNSDDEVQQQRVRKRQGEEDRDETYYGTAADRDAESAVIGGLRSKKKKDKSPSKTQSPTKSPTEPSRAAKAGKITKTASTSAAGAAPAPQQPSAPPLAYSVPPNPPVRPPPIGMDAPNRGPAFAPAPRSPPHSNSTGFSAYQPNVQDPYGRSPTLPQGQYGRSPPHPTSHRQSLANQGGQGHGGYQQPPYGGRR